MVNSIVMKKITINMTPTTAPSVMTIDLNRTVSIITLIIENNSNYNLSAFIYNKICILYTQT